MVPDYAADNDAALLGDLVGGGSHHQSSPQQVQEVVNLSPEEQEMVRWALYEADINEQKEH